MLQIIKLDDRVSGGGHIKSTNKFRNEPDVIGVIGYNQLIAPLRNFYSGLVRKQRTNLFLDLVWFNVLQRKNLQKLLSALWDIRTLHNLRAHLWL